MKSFCLSLCCLVLLLSFWNTQYEDTQLVHHMQQTLSTLQEKRLAKKNEAPYIVLVENQWAKDLYPLWQTSLNNVILTPWDLTKGYTRRKKSFSCNKDVYWLGKAAPGKQLRQLGTWTDLRTTTQTLRNFHLTLNSTILPYTTHMKIFALICNHRFRCTRGFLPNSTCGR